MITSGGRVKRNCKKVAISGGCLSLYVSYLRPELLKLKELGFSQVEILKKFCVNALLQTYCTKHFEFREGDNPVCKAA
jgi:hypothetical protein